jgi:hypothetical protein
MVVLIAALLLACLPDRSQGAVTLTGNIEQIAPPASVVVHVLESDDLARIFVERESFVLASDLTVDFTAVGTYDGVGDLPAVEPVIAAGTVLDSYFVHADNISSQGLREYEGTITFDVEILGVILTNVAATRLLSTADGILGHPGTAYPLATDGARDVELGPGLNLGDQLTLSADRRTLTFHLATEQSADQLRILTAPSTPLAPVPEPASFTLVLLGLAVGAGTRCWRRLRR